MTSPRPRTWSLLALCLLGAVGWWILRGLPAGGAERGSGPDAGAPGPADRSAVDRSAVEPGESAGVDALTGSQATDPSGTRRAADGGLRLRLGPDGPVEGDGVLYARRPGEDPGRAARVLPVQAGRVELGDLAPEDLEPVAARLDGHPYVPADVAAPEPGVLDLRPFHGHLLDVRDVDGAPASHLELERSAQPGIELAAFHPGPSWSKHRLADDAGSPLLVGLGDLGTPERSLYLRSPHSAWTNLAVAPTTAPCLDLDLLPGGALDVDCGPRAGLENLALRLEREGARARTWRPLSARELPVDGLPAGEVRLVLGAPDCSEAEALHVATAMVRPDARTRVRLFDDERPEPALGVLTGTLDLGVLELEEIDAFGRELHVVLVHEEAHPDAGLDHGLGELRTVTRERMQRDPDGARAWRFTTDPLPPGGYRLRVFPFGQQVEAWLEPGTTTAVDLVLPEPARAEVRFRDADTKRPITPSVTTVHQLAAAFGRLCVAPVRWSWTSDPDPVLRVLSVPGTVELSLHDEQYGSVRRELDLPAGASVHEVELHRATWITLDAVGPDGPVTPGDGWWEAIEFVQAGAPAPVLTRAYPFTIGAPVPEDGFATLRVCLEGPDAVTLILPPHPEYGAHAPVTVPAADGDATERRQTLRLGVGR